MNLLTAAVVGLGLWQGFTFLGEDMERQETFQAADAHAKRLGKPLLVVGSPYGSNSHRKALQWPAHGIGDVTIDLDPAVTNVPGGQVADVRRIPFPDQHFGASFVSHVLEHLATVDDAVQAVKELRRVSDGVFIVGPRKQMLTAWFVPDHHLWVNQLEDGRVEIENRPGWQEWQRAPRHFELAPPSTPGWPTEFTQARALPQP